MKISYEAFKKRITVKELLFTQIVKTYEAFNFNKINQQPIDTSRLINDLPLADGFNFFVKANRLDRAKMSVLVSFEKVRKKLAQLQVFNKYLDEVEGVDDFTRRKNATRLDELCAETIKTSLDTKQLDKILEQDDPHEEANQ